MSNTISMEAAEQLNEMIIHNREEFIVSLQKAYGVDIENNERNLAVGRLVGELDKQGFFESPASTQYHGHNRGDLLLHSLNVMKIGINLAKTLNFKEVDKVIMAALLHDIGKTGQFGKQGYIPNVLKTTGKVSDKKPYVVNKELLNVPHEIRSIQIASNYLDIPEDVNHAILYHNGLYGSLKYEIQGNETPLYLIIHMADMWASRIVEVEK